LAGKKDGEHIIGYVKKLSAAFSVHIECKDRIGILKIT
jgi:hypothetical protein